MARREEEEKRGPSLLKLAAGLGVGYVAYRNRNKLVEGISDLARNSQIKLARTTGSRQFRGVMDEAKSLSRSFDEVYDLSPKGIARTARVGGRTQQLNRQLRHYNEGMNARMSRHQLGDIKESLNLMANLQENFGTLVKQGADMRNLDEVLKQKEYAKLFGPRIEAARHIIKNNPKTFFGQSRPKGAHSREGSTIDLSLAHLLKDYQDDAGRSLKLEFANSKEEEGFFANLMTVVEETSERTRRQKNDWQRNLHSPQSLTGNHYAQQMELHQMAAYSAVQDMHKPKETSLLSQMKEGGWRPATMDEARKQYVREQDGKLFLVAQPKEGEQLGKLQDVFGVEIRTDIHLGGRNKARTTKKTQPFAEQYISRGMRYGMDPAELGSHHFSRKLLLNETTGELLNMEAPEALREQIFNSIRDDFQIPFLHFNPLQFLPGQKRQGWGSNNFYVMRGGRDIQPFLKQFGVDELPLADEARNIGAHSNKLGRSYLFMSDRVVDSNMAEVLTAAGPAERFQQFQEHLDDYSLDGRFTLGNARTGLLRQYGEAVANRTNVEGLGERNAFQKLFRLGGQEYESTFGRLKRAYDKFSDPFYSENAIDSVTELVLDGQDDGRGYKEGISRIYGSLFGRTQKLDREAREALYPALNEVLSNRLAGDGPIDLHRATTDDDYLFDLVERIAVNVDPNRRPAPLRGAADVRREVADSLQQRIYNTYVYSFKPDQLDFPNRMRNTKDRGIPTPEKLYAFFPDDRELVKKTDDMRMLVEQFAISQADYFGINLNRAARNTPGVDARRVEDQLSAFRSLNEMNYFSSMAESKDLEQFTAARSLFPKYYREGSIERLNLSYSLQQTDPWHGSGTGKRLGDPLGETQFLAIPKQNTMLESINQRLVEEGSGLHAVAGGISDWTRSLGSYFAGRDGNITTATVGPWFMANRLDTAFQSLGLGLPQADKGSALGILGTQFATRIAAPYMAFQYLMYLDGLTGDAVSDTAADTYVNMHLDVNRLKEASGINAIGREWQRVMPWMEQVGELPGVKAFNAATFGTFSDFRSGEDLAQYYQSGEDPIRKGRYWDIGSNSPWMGDRIERFEPNWYRKLKSDYMFTDTMYGSESEYWANHWLPTPTHPFAPVTHYLADPYHYENKHKDSRPYVLTGGFSELNNIPIVGPGVNRVASMVLKPQRVNPRFKQAHQAYLTAENEKLVSAYTSMNAGGVVEIKGGSITLASDSYNANFVDEDGNLDEEALQMDAAAQVGGRERYAASVLAGLPQLGSVTGVPGGSLSGTGTAVGGTVLGGLASQQALMRINQSLVDGRTVNRNDQVSRAGTLLNPNTVRSMNQVTNPQALLDPDGVWRDLQYNMGEFAGMYGFLGNTALGFDQGGRGATLETSARFNSLNDQFWDMGLGGLGGDFSEIFRRYLPRDPNRDYYNPIRNQMPGWLSGQNYFTDFLHGDPYNKVAKGEMRLPGEA